MQWEFNSDRAIYAQIIEQMKLFIVSGELNPGDESRCRCGSSPPRPA